MTSKLWFFLLCPVFCWSQTLTGTVVDASTNQPLETVSIYFDNTTVGTTTDDSGAFSISYSDAIQSSLVISYLGYEKVIINDYRNQTTLRIALKPSSVALDEVHLEYDDGLTRKQKLRLFRKEFLGTSRFGKSCKILNEDDVILRYDKRKRALYADAKAPIRVENKALKYEIEYDLIDFTASFSYVDPIGNEFVVKTLTFLGTTFYKDLEGSEKKKTQKNRAKAYKGSVQHFMRALYNENLKEEGYWIFYKKFRVDEWSHFSVNAVDDSNFKEVTLKNRVSILFDKNQQSEIQLEVDKFYVDIYGNYSPIIGVYFGGTMGDQRVGDTLPANYGL
ncbi:carboxypeptidase-like regulatory domain-containing protein [Winogradskyella sp.]|uniref:carboxypeptidase-like regulatory domain-containing protein n=1 Tax=Winogradskyella sp. TaxID=1883156 RepID=UPI003BACA89F